jgi:hypothetical protein
VAVKVLQDRFTPNSGTARRFGDEARIAAQLQHPGIPPVHDLGKLPDGRPFLAMKLIKGQTLDDLLSARSNLSAEHGRYLAVFEQICQALAYAHAHNVIHRDLKPANVMVGSFGEVQVMDWGLAKVLSSHTDTADDQGMTRNLTEVGTLRDSDSEFTQDGSVLGTPAYMPPEQAVGAVGKVDERSDVFGLGGILAVILTGRPPFAANTAETTRIQAAQGNLDGCFERLDACGAEPELVALCKSCLSPKPVNRPSNAGAVAKAVAQLRQAADERARRAELDRVRVEGEKLAAELKVKEQRKRRRVQNILAGAVTLFIVAGLAAGWWIDRQAERARRKEADYAAEQLRIETEKRAEQSMRAAREQMLENSAQDALVEAETQLRAGKPTEARVALNKADGLLVGGGSELSRSKAGDVRRELEMLVRLDDIALMNVEIPAQSKEENSDSSPWKPPEGLEEKIARQYADAFQWYGIDVLGLPEADAVAALASRPIRRDLAAALVAWTKVAPLQRDRLAKILTAADPITDGPRKEFAAALANSDRTAMAKAAIEIDPMAVPPGRLLATAYILQQFQQPKVRPKNNFRFCWLRIG